MRYIDDKRVLAKKQFVITDVDLTSECKMDLVTGARTSMEGRRRDAPCNSFFTTKLAVGSAIWCNLWMYEIAERELVIEL